MPLMHVKLRKKQNPCDVEKPLNNQTTVERILVVKQTRVIDVRVGAFAQRHVHSVKRDGSARFGGGPSQTYETANETFYLQVPCTFIQISQGPGLKPEVLPFTLCFPFGSFVMCEAFLSSCL